SVVLHFLHADHATSLHGDRERCAQARARRGRAGAPGTRRGSQRALPPPRRAGDRRVRRRTAGEARAQIGGAASPGGARPALSGGLPRRSAPGVARVMVLDAGVLIALADDRDAHHLAARRFIEANIDERFAANAVNIAESLVHAVDGDVAESVLEAYELIGIIPLDVTGESAAPIARVRAETRLRMPDALA